jgi:hypothetical protein
MKADVDKMKLGFSTLTKQVYIFIPDKSGDAKDKKDVTHAFHTIAKRLGYVKPRKEIDDECIMER